MSFTRSLFGVAFIASICLSSCGYQPPLYYTTASESALKTEMNNGVQLKYVVIQDDFSQELKAVLQGIKDKKYISFISEKAKILQDPFEKNFAMGYILLLDREFEMAQVHFVVAAQKIPQSNILWLDCMVEMKNNTDLYADYQKLYDETEDPLLREIIKTRYKYYRHAI